MIVSQSYGTRKSPKITRRQNTLRKIPFDFILGHKCAESTIGDKIITYRFFCLGVLFSVIVTGNFTA